MIIHLGSQQPLEFRAWRPADGIIFHGPIAIDTETTLIDQTRPWLIPVMVMAAATDGTAGVYLTRDSLPAFLRAHTNNPLIFHNASFDLGVIDKLDPSLAIYDRVDQALVWDTQLLHRLFVLATAGHTARGGGQSTLETCTRFYLGAELPKDTTDADGDVVRTSYGKFLGHPPAEVPAVYLDYLGKDVIATMGVWAELHRRINDRLRNATGYGYVSDTWLDEQVRCWGPLTHHIQLMAEIVLDHISRNGMHIDVARRDELDAEFRARELELLDSLREFGYLPGDGSQKALQAILRRAERQTGVTLPKTPTGKFSTSESSLELIAEQHSFVKLYLEYKAVSKLRKTFLSKLATGVVRPSYNVLVATGRTSSFGEINAQNLPKTNSVRGCFVPRPGHKFVVADYAAIELRTLGQALASQFDLSSELVEQLNAGVDPHRRLAARLTGKSEAEVTKAERQSAKAINFGKPGGMGNAALQRYAKASFGVDLSEDEVTELTEAYFTEYPEIKEFLHGDPDERGGLTAIWLGLTPVDHYDQTGDSRFVDHPENADWRDIPHPILGAMALKTYRDDEPQTRNGAQYAAHDIDYFWTRLRDRIADLPQPLRRDVDDGRPSPELHRAVGRLADRDGVWTLTGRLRANANWTARHNCVFQGLAADGAKLALWILWRTGYRIVAFVHDEVLIEVPDDEQIDSRKNEITRIMIEAMRLVVPDVRIDVEADVRTTWADNPSPISLPEATPTTNELNNAHRQPVLVLGGVEPDS